MQRVLRVLKVLAASYLVTGVVLLILTTLLYHFEMGEKIILPGIITAYLLSGFFGGFLIGKQQKEKKFLWGAITGTAYFLVLVFLSLLVYREIQGEIGDFFTTLVLCVGSATLGGMLS